MLTDLPCLEPHAMGSDSAAWRSRLCRPPWGQGGHTTFGGAPMVTAWVSSPVACGTTSSSGSAARASSALAPQRSPGPAYQQVRGASRRHGPHQTPNVHGRPLTIPAAPASPTARFSPRCRYRAAPLKD
jgi:hypothetical protein